MILRFNAYWGQVDYVAAMICQTSTLVNFLRTNTLRFAALSPKILISVMVKRCFGHNISAQDPVLLNQRVRGDVLVCVYDRGGLVSWTASVRSEEHKVFSHGFRMTVCSFEYFDKSVKCSWGSHFGTKLLLCLTGFWVVS